MPLRSQMLDQQGTAVKIIILDVETIWKIRIIIMKKYNRGSPAHQPAVKIQIGIGQSAFAAFHNDALYRFFQQSAQNPPFFVHSVFCDICFTGKTAVGQRMRSEEHTSELQS